MSSTNSTSDNNDVKILLPQKAWLLNLFKDKGMTVVIMFGCMWIMYNWIEQSRTERNEQVREQNEQIKDLRRIVDNCASAKKDQLELDVQAANFKLDKLLTHQNID